MPICNIASTTCCCPRASRDLGWNSIRVSWTDCNSSPARCLRNTVPYGGVVDIQTKSGAFDQGCEVECMAAAMTRCVRF